MLSLNKNPFVQKRPTPSERFCAEIIDINQGYRNKRKTMPKESQGNWGMRKVRCRDFAKKKWSKTTSDIVELVSPFALVTPEKQKWLFVVLLVVSGCFTLFGVLFEHLVHKENYFWTCHKEVKNGIPKAWTLHATSSVYNWGVRGHAIHPLTKILGRTQKTVHFDTKLFLKVPVCREKKNPGAKSADTACFVSFLYICFCQSLLLSLTLCGVSLFL